MSQVTSHLCSVCNEPHIVMQAKKLHMDRQKIDMLKRASVHVILHNDNRFKKSELNLVDFGQSAYGNFPSLARFGLIAKAWDKQTQRPIRGIWVITRLGWAFLRGDATVKSWVMVKDKHVQHGLGYGSEMTLTQMRLGIDTIQTNFEYYDDDNRMVAFRPGVPIKPEQGTLL